MSFLTHQAFALCPSPDTITTAQTPNIILEPCGIIAGPGGSTSYSSGITPDPTASVDFPITEVLVPADRIISGWDKDYSKIPASSNYYLRLEFNDSLTKLLPQYIASYPSLSRCQSDSALILGAYPKFYKAFGIITATCIATPNSRSGPTSGSGQKP